LLDGVPVSIKDLILTKGWPTVRGSKTVDPKGPWNDDAPATARLREHGAVLLGKTTTPEFGWKGVTDSPLTGITRNPWNPKKTPGGSSGGAVAAVASGMGPLAVGTDGGGSIRIPCSFAGLFGIKPSFGRVPAWPLSPFGTVAHVGPAAFAGAAALVNGIPAEKRKLVDPGLLEVAAEGAKMTAAEVLDAQMKRGALGAQMNLFHRDYDLLVTPTLAVAAFDAGVEFPPGKK